MVAREVERVFTKRRWDTFGKAESATGIPVGTLQRLRKGLGKAETIVRFGVAAGEDEAYWKRIAIGLADGTEPPPAPEIKYELDPEISGIIELYEGLPPDKRKTWITIGEVFRDETGVIGKRRDRGRDNEKENTEEEE